MPRMETSGPSSTASCALQRVAGQSAWSCRRTALPLLPCSIGGYYHCAGHHLRTCLRPSRGGVAKRLGPTGDIIGWPIFSSRMLAQWVPHSPPQSSCRTVSRRKEPEESPTIAEIVPSEFQSEGHEASDSGPAVSPRRAIPGKGVRALRIWSPSRSNSSWRMAKDVCAQLSDPLRVSRFANKRVFSPCTWWVGHPTHPSPRISYQTPAERVESASIGLPAVLEGIRLAPLGGCICGNLPHNATVPALQRTVLGAAG
jgi:hypothetical protein